MTGLETACENWAGISDKLFCNKQLLIRSDFPVGMYIPVAWQQLYQDESQSPEMSL